jgi:hypothetical protein
MPAVLRRLRTKPQRLSQAQAEQLRQLVIDMPGLPGKAVGAIVKIIDRETAAENGWTFVMLSPAQNKAVVNWLIANSKRKDTALQLWAEMFEHLDRDTGEIVLTRAEMAEAVKALPRHISEITAELEGIDAVVRRYEGRSVRYFMNPNVATHLPEGERERAQADHVATSAGRHRRVRAKEKAGGAQAEAGPALRLVTS